MPAALPATADVLIVGAGPTGLALAATLQQAGVGAVLVDRLDHGQNTSRAAVLHAHTLEVLDAIGVTPALLADGLAVTKFCLRDRDRALLRLDFEELPSRYATLLMLPQERTELHLEAALRAAGGHVHRGCAVSALRNGGDRGVHATIATAAGEHTLRARFVVGADGMHSAVRQAAGIGFTGSSYEDSFVLADVTMDWPLGRAEVALFFAPAGLVVIAPLPGGRFRIVATLQDAPPQPGVADVQALLDTRGPRERGDARAIVREVHWSTRFRVHHRVADHYRSGPFLLVGDAAHVHSPAGGQGMNTGLVDAFVLGRMLADVVLGRAAPSHLDGYERLRRPAAVQVLGLAGRLTAMATLRSAPLRAGRNLAFRIAGCLPFVRRRLLLGFSGIARRAAAIVPAAGAR